MLYLKTTARVLPVDLKRALNRALLDATRNGHLTGMKNLLDQGANVNTRNTYDETGENYNNYREDAPTLIVAILERQFESFKLLLERGADPDQRDGSIGITPLMFCAFELLEHYAKLLLEHSARKDLTTDQGHTLHSFLEMHLKLRNNAAAVRFETLINSYGEK